MISDKRRQRCDGRKVEKSETRFLSLIARDYSIRKRNKFLRFDFIETKERKKLQNPDASNSLFDLHFDFYVRFFRCFLFLLFSSV